MGNQLTGIAPSQILPTEHYFTDVADYQFECSLGSTRFFKVAKARHKEGKAVVKVFAIHDPSLPLKAYKDYIEDIQVKLSGNTNNILPFQKVIVSDNKAALLFRQYVKDSLYDRMSTRPFLNVTEKKWIAFQLLCALNQLHKLKVCHGDVKSENVMITSWTWVLLTDIASFKPTYLPEDDPADFSYFFDTSRRRTCYIAPERFIESNARNVEASFQNASVDLTSSFIKKGDLMPAMDVFSAGCVVTELFTDGHAPFDLSQLLAYRIGEYSPWKVLEKIEDTNVRELVRHMMQKEPSSRMTVEEYLIQQRGKAFPEYFYTFMKIYLQRFASTPIIPPDERITRNIKRDLPEILQNLEVSVDSPDKNQSLVLIISLITSNLRSLQYCATKLTALELLLQLAKYLTADMILDRLIPFMLYLVNDPFPQVRAATLKTITECLANVKTVPRSDANIFPEYILPSMSHLTQDEAATVRVAYAENIALLAETALRFLEIVQLTSSEQSNEETSSTSHTLASYDAELQALHEMIQQKVVTLLSDPDNSVKQTLLENGITRLCVFFGRQKANDVLLSHMITFLNDKYDWHLRGAFFDSIVGVAAYVGWQSSTILKPLLQQGLTDTEEFVITKTLAALKSLTELGLFQKPLLHDLLKEVIPFLCHPGVYIRQAAVGYISAVAKSSNIADVHCNLLPQLKPYLKQQIIQVEKEVILLNALEDPIPRAVYDYILRTPLIDKLFLCLQKRQLIRNITRQGHKPGYPEMDENLSQLLRKLQSQGMSESDEDKFLALEDFMQKLHRSRAGSSDSSLFDEDDTASNGVIDLRVNLGSAITIRHADLKKIPESKHLNNVSAQPRKSKKKALAPDSPPGTMNEEWKSMFGSTVETDSLQSSPKLKSKVDQNVQLKGDTLTGATQLQQSSSDSSLKKSPSPQPERAPLINRYSTCKLELSKLVGKKRSQYEADMKVQELSDGNYWTDHYPPTNWKPKGLLVAHLHEHKSAVNRISVSHDQQYFATCSNDGSIKIWDCVRMIGRTVTSRSKLTYKQGGVIRTLTFCEGSDSIASASNTGTIHVYRLELGQSGGANQVNKISLYKEKNLDVEKTGVPVDITYFDTGKILAYATVHGYMIGWDLRSPTPAWTFKNEPKYGLVTSFSVHHTQSWLASGTSSGAHICWDLRFQLPITTVVHPTGARVRKLITHPLQQSWLISAVQGNNEVSVWNVETGARQTTFWASSAPALSTTQASNHSVNGMWFGNRDMGSYILTAGSDMRIRCWDMAYPSNSYIVAGAASDPNQTVVSYKTRLIDGTEVIQETYKQRIQNEDVPRRSPDNPPSGHHDMITDINVCQANQSLIITCSRDGVVKVWK
ncbi:phosphoinositide 3-kinase regulatory subunit 4-like [Tubulanus polymorphus]|uniref:phosphoinositide 3-kinase regulatory subunit 4-like n=1 Tax=Tubulanus polymorphus TaxID=672921 RepID=UPI003DA6ADBA